MLEDLSFQCIKIMNILNIQSFDNILIILFVLNYCLTLSQNTMKINTAKENPIEKQFHATATRTMHLKFIRTSQLKKQKEASGVKKKINGKLIGVYKEFQCIMLMSFSLK